MACFTSQTAVITRIKAILRKGSTTIVDRRRTPQNTYFYEKLFFALSSTEIKVDSIRRMKANSFHIVVFFGLVGLAIFLTRVSRNRSNKYGLTLRNLNKPFIIILCAFVLWYCFGRRLRSVNSADTQLQQNISKAKQQVKSAQTNLERLSGHQLFKLAEAYDKGRYGTPVNKNKARTLYLKASEKGYAQGYVSLANLAYEQGSKQGVEEALNLYVQAVRAGCIAGLLDLGRLYERGLHPYYHPDSVVARSIYELLIENTTDQDLIRQARLRISESLPVVGSDIEPGSLPIPSVIQRLNAIFRDNTAPVVAPIFETTFTPPVRTVRGNTVGGAAAVPVFDLYTAPNIQGGDSQNVHNTFVNTTAAKALSDLARTTPVQTTTNATIEAVQQTINSSNVSPEEKADAARVLQSLNFSNHSRFNMSERDILDLVWARINAPTNAEKKEDLQELLVKSLASGVEHGHVVCSSGKALRVIGALDCVDEAVNIRPDWAVNEEIGSVVAAVRKRTLDAATDDARLAYDALEPTEEQQAVAERLQEVMKKEVVDKCSADYVSSDLMTPDALNARLAPYLEAI